LGRFCSAIADDARENLAGVDVISVGPLWGELGPGGMQYSVVVRTATSIDRDDC
jgi:hypothetical protein